MAGLADMLPAGPPPKGAPEPEAGDSYDGDGEMAMEDFLAAAKAGDAKAAWSAFKAMHSMCAMNQE